VKYSSKITVVTSLIAVLKLIGDFWYARMFCHIGLQATNAEISSYMIWQSYWNLYHWQTEHKSGAIVMVLRHILAKLCEMFSVTPMVT
jgi:hypothetical protein